MAPHNLPSASAGRIPFPSQSPFLPRFGVHLEQPADQGAAPPSLLPEDLTTLKPAEIAKLEERLLKAYDGLKKQPISAANVAARKEHVEAIGAIRLETGRRAEEAKALEAEAADLDAAVTPPEPGAAADAPEAGSEGAATGTEAEAAAEPQQVAASAQPVRTRPRAPRADMAVTRPESRPQISRQFASVTAAGDVPGISAGSDVPEDAMGLAFAEKASALLAGAGRGHASGKVLRMSIEYPEDRHISTRDSSSASEAKVQAITASANRHGGLSFHGPDALVAAGGLCAPAAVDYTLQTIATASRPVRDAMTRFGADRGALRFILPPHLSDVVSGISSWPESTDAAWTPGSPGKPFVTLTCGEEELVEVGAVVMSAVNGNFNARFFPEQWEAWYTLMLAQHARLADSLLLDGIKAASVATTTGRVLGTARDTLVHLGTAADGYRNRNRMDKDAILQALLPETLLGQMRSDFTRQQPGDNAVALADNEILGYLANYNIEPNWYKDSPSTGVSQLFSGQGVGELEGYPSVVQAALFAPGSFLFLDGGTLDLGVEIRDFSLDQTNRVAAFMESFEATAFHGVESLWISMPVCDNGETSAAVVPLACGGS